MISDKTTEQLEKRLAEIRRHLVAAYKANKRATMYQIENEAIRQELEKRKGNAI